MPLCAVKLVTKLLIDSTNVQHTSFSRILISGWQMFYVEFNTPPIPKENGCSISPANGTAGVTEFSVSCDDDAFIDEDSPFKYEYFSSFTKTGSRIPVHGKKSKYETKLYLL